MQYQKLKEELESKYADDRVAYTNGKQDMIDVILDNQADLKSKFQCKSKFHRLLNFADFAGVF